MKKAIALTLAAAMAAGLLAGCGGGSASSAASSTAGSSEAAASGKPTITFMMPTFYGTEFQNEGVDQVIEKYESYTGVHVEWRLEANDTYKDKFGLTLMDKDNMPMVLTASGALDANIVDAAKKGAFWDLGPFLADTEAYPNLSQANENVLKGLTVDGQIIGIPRTRPIGRYGFAYRTDWAEKCGITEEPKTIEDVYNMLYAFTYDDPDGNGQDDTYGMEMCKYTGPLDIIQTWFGCGNGWVEQDGKLVPVHQTEEYREALQWMRKIYEDGLIRPDWATVDTSTWSDGCKKGEAGCFVDVMDSSKRIWNYFTDNNVADVNDPSKTATMTLQRLGHERGQPRHCDYRDPPGHPARSDRQKGLGVLPPDLRRKAAVPHHLCGRPHRRAPCGGGGPLLVRPRPAPPRPAGQHHVLP